MHLFKQIHDFRFVNPLVRYYNIALRSLTHYDVLSLRKNCSEKDIKEAFIHLSKEYHPDKNSDPKAQQKFVRIVEAYSILSKPSSRANYDKLLEHDRFMGAHSNLKYRAYEAYGFKYNSGQKPQYNSYTHQTKKKTSTAEETMNKQYHYGVHAVKKFPNYAILLICFGVAFVATVLQVVVIREIYSIHRRQMMERSRYLSEELEKVRAAANNSTNDEQTRLILEKIVSASNPTVATASLGQSLANPKE